MDDIQKIVDQITSAIVCALGADQLDEGVQLDVKIPITVPPDKQRYVIDNIMVPCTLEFFDDSVYILIKG
jgi:hypothetical protein